ncbi:unnamed protein product, partial [Prorocentrum cordatum]
MAKYGFELNYKPGKAAATLHLAGPNLMDAKRKYNKEGGVNIDIESINESATVVAAHKHLGVELTADNTWQPEIQKRAICHKQEMKNLKTICTNPKTTAKDKLKYTKRDYVDAMMQEISRAANTEDDCSMIGMACTQLKEEMVAKWRDNIDTGHAALQGIPMILEIMTHITNTPEVKDLMSFQADCVGLRGDRQVVLAAVRRWGAALQFAAPELRADREVALAAVGVDGLSLPYVAPELRGDREVVLAAVRSCGSSLAHADARLRADRGVALELQSDREVVLEASRTWGSALTCAAEALRGDPDFVCRVVRVRLDALK